MVEAAHPPLILALCNPALHGKPEGGVKLVETHISWVILAGEYAYKIKKPVNFGFLDFSSLNLRRQYCQEELRLNRRFSPDLYLGVATITGRPDQPNFDGDGQVLEYAVKLRRFDEDKLADRLLAQNRITPKLIDGLAHTLAEFHRQASRSTAGDPHGRAEAILDAAEHNFDHLLKPNHKPVDLVKQSRLKSLLNWTHAEFLKLRDTFQNRKDAGFIRECHGDLHSGNLVLIDGRLQLFDCIEFSEDLRWIDCISEIAFIFMDLEVRGHPALAWRLLNHYMEITGDFAGLEVFSYYQVYRALVRAKVAILAMDQVHDAVEHAHHKTLCLSYLDYAERTGSKNVPTLLIAHGYSGSGKSHGCVRLSERLPAIRIVSDVERKRLAGLDALQPGTSDKLYSESMTRQTYAMLYYHAEHLLLAGFNVLLDATFLNAEFRRHGRELADRLGVGFKILSFQAPKSLLSQRIAARLASHDHASDANLEVLARQITLAEPLQESEWPLVLNVDGTRQIDVEEILNKL